MILANDIKYAVVVFDVLDDDYRFSSTYLCATLEEAEEYAKGFDFDLYGWANIYELKELPKSWRSEGNE